MVISNLADAARANGDVGSLVQAHLAQYATYEDDAFAALNTAFAADGAFVHVPEDSSLKAPLHLIYVTTDGPQPTASYPRTLVVAERHSRLTVIESYVSLSSSQHFTNAVTEIVLDEGASVEHYRLLMDNPESFHVGNTRVYQDKDSTFSSASFARGAAVARTDALSDLVRQRGREVAVVAVSRNEDAPLVGGRTPPIDEGRLTMSAPHPNL